MLDTFIFNELTFDIDELTIAKDKCDELANALNDEKNKLITELQALRDEDWQTQAGRDYMANVDGDWSAQVDRYVELTLMISELLQKAITQYRYVVYEANSKETNEKLTTVIPHGDNI